MRFDRLSPSAFWLEAARRITANAVRPLERVVAECAPSLAPHLDTTSARAATAVFDADAAPLAFMTCDVASRTATLRLVHHIVGDPISSTAVDCRTVRGLAPPANSRAVVHVWGVDTADANKTSRSVPVSRSSRPSLRRFSLALVFPIESEQLASGLGAVGYPTRPTREDGLDDDDDCDESWSESLQALCSAADARFIVVDLEAASRGATSFARQLSPQDSAVPSGGNRDVQIAYIFVAGRLVLAGLGAVLKALGTALFHVSRLERKLGARPDFFVVAPLDQEMRRTLGGHKSTLVRDLARDERRLMRIFAALPRARAHSAIEALLSRARLARTAASAVEAVAKAARCGPTWRSVARWMAAGAVGRPRRNGHRDDEDERAARRALADIDVPELRALAAERQLPIEAFRTALRQLDRRKWTKAYSSVFSGAPRRLLRPAGKSSPTPSTAPSPSSSLPCSIQLPRSLATRTVRLDRPGPPSDSCEI